MQQTTRHPKIKIQALLSIGLLAGLIFVGDSLFANANRVYIECPCTFERTEDGELAVTMGFRSFRESNTRRLRVDVFFYTSETDIYGYYAGTVRFEPNIPANAEIEAKTYYGEFLPRVSTSPIFDREGYVRFALYRNWDRSGGYQDRVAAAGSTTLTEPFKLNEVDYLTDTDDDGVSDRNELREGTDPNDPDSFPEPAVIDVLALYSPGFSDFHDGDPFTRIRHVMTITNSILRNSEVSVRVRLVGIQPVEISDYRNFAGIDVEAFDEEGDRHGADMAVVFKGAADAFFYYCGYTYLTGLGFKGMMPLQTDRLYTAYVVRGCRDSTTSHEIGHILGLGHSEHQNEVGTWRWSRGHAVRNEFYTVMSYSSLGGIRSSVFSNPDVDDCLGNDCGVHEEDEFAANAARSIDAVQWQFEDLRPGFPDSDDDGFVDPVDAVPDDPDDWLDTDGDGIGNNSDDDDDGDGIADIFDSFPLDADEFLDSDLDGVGNNADPFPLDASEWADSDGDGVGDNADVFPLDPNETTDFDGDGVGDNSDAFPEDSTETHDTDGDGTGDNADEDDDNDGYADNEDAFPRDPEKVDLASYDLRGENRHDRFGHAIVSLGDINADGFAEFAISAPHFDVDDKKDSGVVYLLSSHELDQFDSADGSTDRTINVEHWRYSSNNWLITHSVEKAEFGTTLDVADVNADGIYELVIGSPGDLNEDDGSTGSVYILDLGELGTIDTADGSSDHTIDIANYTVGTRTLKLTNDGVDSRLGSSLSVNDVDNNGRDDLILGADQYNEQSGVAYFVHDSALVLTEDEEDSDGIPNFINLDQSVSSTNLWKFIGKEGDQFGSSLSIDGQFNEDDTSEITIGSQTFGRGDSGAVFIVPFGLLGEVDAIDGEEDGVLNPLNIAVVRGTYTLESEDSSAGLKIHADGDINGDGLTELVIEYLDDAEILVIAGQDLVRADLEDSIDDGRILIDNARVQINSYLIIGATTSSACCNNVTMDLDLDDDGMNELVIGADRFSTRGGVIHTTFQQMLNSSRNIGYSPRQGLLPVHPRHASRTTFNTFVGYERLNGIGQTIANIGDLNQDGIADLAIGAPAIGHDGQSPGVVHVLLSIEEEPLDEIDGDLDDFSRIHNLAGDTDGDGTKDTFDSDDDGDGYIDANDRFPLLATEWVDADNDGYGDNLDVFPFDRDEWFDTDFDGTGDNADEDADGDGIDNVDDEFPYDTDNDGIDNRFDDDDDNDGVNDDDDSAPLDPDVS